MYDRLDKQHICGNICCPNVWVALSDFLVASRPLDDKAVSLVGPPLLTNEDRGCKIQDGYNRNKQRCELVKVYLYLLNHWNQLPIQAHQYCPWEEPLSAHFMVRCYLWTSIIERHECKLDTKIYFAYFTFFAHASQYFSTKITPSPTLNKASWVALRPQVTQNFGFELVLSSNDLRCIKFFCIFKSLPHKPSWNCCWNSNTCYSFVNIPTIHIRACLLSLVLFNSSLLDRFLDYYSNTSAAPPMKPV